MRGTEVQVGMSLYVFVAEVVCCCDSIFSRSCFSEDLAKWWQNILTYGVTLFVVSVGRSAVRVVHWYEGYHWYSLSCCVGCIMVFRRADRPVAVATQLTEVKRVGWLCGRGWFTGIGWYVCCLALFSYVYLFSLPSICVFIPILTKVNHGTWFDAFFLDCCYF